ncbi:MAG: DUF4838 domain-containing protein [Lentisphaeria bacterium]|nr:DUF4838 domain-containing protein [Lentisphaeria bacterium]
MKKLLCLQALCFGLLLSGAAPLFDNGKSAWQITIPAKADPAERYAAEELQTFLQKISGAKINIVSTDAPAKNSIIIGSLFTSPLVKKNASALRLKESNTEMLTVKLMGDKLYLCGDVPRGALYAVYTFLQKQLDCRWFWPGDDGEFIVKRSTYQLPALDYSSKPSFRFREMTPCGMHNHVPTEIWLARNLMNGGSRTPKVRDNAGFYKLDGQHWVSVDRKLFDTKPELFSLINGKREKSGYAGCWSNPEFFDYIVKKHLNIIKTRGFNMLNSFPADIIPRCECEKCTVIKDKSSRWYEFYAKLIEAIRKHHPEILFGGIAYQEYRAVPERPVKYLEYVEYCQYNRCYVHKLNDPKCKINANSMKTLRQWQSKAPMGLYGYEFDVFKVPMYLPFWNMIADEMKLFRDMKLVRIKTELGVNMRKNVPRLNQKQLAHRLSNYIYARLMWNADEKIDDILNDWCKYLYGGGAEAMKLYHTTMAQAWDKMALHLTYFGASPGGAAAKLIDPKMIKFAKSQFKKAKAASGVTPRQLKEIEFEANLFKAWVNEYNLARSNAVIINLPLLKGNDAFSQLGSFKFTGKPNRKKVSPLATGMRLYYTKDALHIQVDAAEPAMDKVRKGKVGKDISPWNDDMVEMFIDFNDGTLHRQLCVNLAGGTYDAIGMDGKWNANWSGKTTFYKDRWVMHITLPFKSFNVNPRPGSQWKLVIIRNSKPAASGFPAPYHQDLGQAATLVFSGKSTPERRLTWIASPGLAGGGRFDKSQRTYLQRGWQFRKFTGAEGAAKADLSDSKVIVIETYKNQLPLSFYHDKLLPAVNAGAVVVLDSYFWVDKLAQQFKDPTFAVSFKEDAGTLRKPTWLSPESVSIKPNNLKRAIWHTPSGTFTLKFPEKWIVLGKQRTRSGEEKPFLAARPLGKGMVVLMGDLREKVSVLENLLEYNKTIKR